jgi:hypothetical protein
MNQVPRGFNRRQVLIGLAFAAVSLGALYIGLPNLAGLGDTWRRLDRGEPGWLTAGLILEIASFFCYVALFRGVIGHEAGMAGRRATGSPWRAWRRPGSSRRAGSAASR